jgi:two-component system, OmpR family, response regulator
VPRLIGGAVRRNQAMEPADNRRSNQNCLSAGPIKLDLDGFSASVAGLDVPLTRTEFLLMIQFLGRPYSTFTRERLVKALHSGEAIPAAPLISPRSMDVHIARLRGKLRVAGVDCIKTTRFVGYRFVPPADPSGEAR